MVKFKEDMVLSNFEMDATVSLLANKWVEVMTYEVPNGETRFFGNGAIVNGVDDRGEWSMNLKTSGDVVISGNARIKARDPNGWKPRPGTSPRSEQLSNNVRLGYTGIGAKTDSFLVIEFKADTSATATLANSDLSLPTTVVQGE